MPEYTVTVWRRPYPTPLLPIRRIKRYSVRVEAPSAAKAARRVYNSESKPWFKSCREVPVVTQVKTKAELALDGDGMLQRKLAGLGEIEV